MSVFVSSASWTFATARELTRVLGALPEAEPDRLLLDLDRVTFINSGGLHAIVLAQRFADNTGRRLAVRYTSPQVRRLFEISGVGEHLDVE